ncbi:MAG TPA: hypothetical protein VKR58_10170 [Aquella sp.]|nr:hypothetical protein [Aquella sp.]
MIDLQKSLSDIALGHVVQNQLVNCFDNIAVLLLRQTKIVTPKDHFHFREIEIYFYDKEIHKDPYTHKNPRQGEFGEWYFHRYTDISTFLKSNRNGVDITFGNKDQKLFGGILIRKIQNTTTNELIVGINKVSRELIANIGEENTNAIALGVGGKAFDNKQILHLEVDGNNYSAPIYKTQRNGLAFRDDELSRDYFKIPYCYYNHNLNNSQIIEVRSAV